MGYGARMFVWSAFAFQAFCLLYSTYIVEGLFWLNLMRSKAGAGKGRSPTPTPNRDGGAATGGAGSGGAAAPTTTGGTTGVARSTLHANKTILKTVSVFLASGKRNSSNQQSKAAAAALQNKRQQRQRRMDELSGKVNPKLLDSLRKKTRFTKDELDALCRIYRKLVSNCQYAAKTLASSSSSAAIAKPHAAVEGIDRIVFRELLHSTFDIVTEEILMERIFCSWDKAHEGLPLRLEGWLIGLSTFLRGTPAERATFCFRVYDLNTDGFITKDEMFTLLRNCLIKQPQDEDPDEGVKDLVEIVLKKFDLDKDGKVSLEDFMGTVTAEPLLIEAFGQCLPTDSAVVSFFSTLQV
ncbi:EF-hand calcium-binding domain-containing protein 1 isoform X2 [Drosophila eugracilis]|uniref:EF-hand calcium-binding domain-containing protein 1 isoform X2 n=1 Tax=Drosophila eugracilis TaxID=29029 RepID=UPI0007E8A1BB|nr:EF-hand calcium-binding domain-containing protein 1 isoform X2 [Drosophila eugracilis]